MRILIAHNQYLEPGGEDQVVEAERSLLSARGQDVKLYLRSNKELHEKPFFKKINFVWKEAFGSHKTYYDLLDLVKTFKPDVAHIHNIFLAISPSIYDVFFDHKVAVVQTIHNYRFFCSNGLFFRSGGVCEDCLERTPVSAIRYRCWRRSMFASGIIMKIQEKLQKDYLCSSKIDRYIAPSAFTKEKLVQCGLPEGKISIKPHFMLTKQQHRNEKKKYAVFIGRLVDYKGVMLLVDAFRELKDYPLKIIGDGPLANEVSQKVAGLAHIDMLGRRSPSDLREIMDQAVCLIAPSLCYETFGRTVIEAFSQGIPVIVSQGGALQESVSDPSLGCVLEENSAPCLARTVKSLWQRVQASEIDADKIREKAALKYGPEDNYQSLMKIYQQALEHNKSTMGVQYPG